MFRVRKGKIVAFRGSWHSGLGALVIVDSESGIEEAIPCDNAPTVRALEGAFGNVIAGGHTLNPKGGHVGKEIYWSTDDLGLILECFTPVDDAPPELVEYFHEERAKAVGG